MLKQVLLFLLLFFFTVGCLHAQQKVLLLQKDSTLPVVDTLHPKNLQQQPDTTIALTVPPVINKQKSTLSDLLKKNIFLNSTAIPVSQIQSPRKYISKDAVFYLLCLIILFLGTIKVAWPRYFSNLVRVFFNTSLRQGQLTDQLLQAKLPSMFFNLFFVLIGGFYLYLILNYFGKTTYDNWKILLICISSLFFIYVIKFCTLKFAGWLTGYKQEAETYIFVVFLINKIISICLVPIVVILPFSAPGLVHVTVIISYVIIVLMFIMRFFRSYGLLQSKLKLSGFHFLLYILGIELLPLLLIYKVALVIMSKSL